MPTSSLDFSDLGATEVGDSPSPTPTPSGGRSAPSGLDFSDLGATEVGGGPSDSSTPLTDKALSDPWHWGRWPDVPKEQAGMPPDIAWIQRRLREAPTPVRAAGETALGVLPTSLGQVAEMATPLTGAIKGLVHDYGAITDWAKGRKSFRDMVEDLDPEGKALQQQFEIADKTPAGSYERWKLGTDVIGQLLTAAALRKSMIEVGGELNASRVRGTTPVSELEVRPQVGQETSLRPTGAPAGAGVSPEEPLPAGPSVAAKVQAVEHAPTEPVSLPEGSVEEGLNTEYESVAKHLDRYTHDNDPRGLLAALKDPRYGEYHADLQRLLRKVFGYQPIRVRRIVGYSGGGGLTVEPQYVSVSTNPDWGAASLKRGMQVQEFEVNPSDVVAAGNEAEGELIVKRDALKRLGDLVGAPPPQEPQAADVRALAANFNALAAEGARLGEEANKFRRGGLPVPKPLADRIAQINQQMRGTPPAAVESARTTAATQRPARKTAARREPAPARAKEPTPGVTARGGMIEEPPPAEPQVSGISARVAEQLKPKIGEIEPGEGMSPEEMKKLGRQRLAKGDDPRLAVAQFKAIGKIDPSDIALVGAHVDELTKVASRLDDRRAARPNDPIAAGQAERAWTEVKDWLQDKLGPMKTAWQKAGVAMQGETEIDTGSYTGLRRAMNEINGRDPDPAEATELRKRAAEVQSAENAVKEAGKKMSDTIAKETKGKKTPKWTVQQARQHFAERLKELAPC